MDDTLISMIKDLTNNEYQQENPYTKGIPFQKTGILNEGTTNESPIDYSAGFENLVDAGLWTQKQLEEFYNNPYDVWEEFLNK